MNIYAYGDGGVSEQVRLLYPLSHMIASKNFDYMLHTGTIREGTKLPADSTGIYIFSRPMTNLEFAIHQFKKLKVPIIADVDDNFWSIPKSHVGYNAVGPGSLNLRSLERILPMVDIVTVSTEPLKQLILERGFAKNVVVIPNVCNSHNEFNCFRRQYSRKIRYGFTGTITHREDFKVMLKPLLQFLGEHPEVQIVTCIDPEVYKYFSRTPEQQKLFVPAYEYKYYPVQLSFFDVMLIPLVNDSFNQGKSDIKVLDAIVNGKPFIASGVLPYMPYKNSGAGLVVSNNPNDWYSAFNQMLSEETRKKFSIAGLKLSKEHNVEISASVWKSLIKGLMGE